jgi:hypothetical protein
VINAVTFLQDTAEEYLLSVSDDKTSKVWSAPDGQLLKEMKLKSSVINMHQFNSKHVLFLFFVNVYIIGCMSGGNRRFHHI